MTPAELSRLRWIAKHGPVVNFAMMPVDIALLDAGFLKTDKGAVYITPAGLKALEGECEMTDEQAALAWLKSWENAINQYPGYNPDAHNHARTIKAMLAEPRLPEKPPEEALRAMVNGYLEYHHLTGERMEAAYHALYAHLSKPRTKTVEVWRVEWADKLTPDSKWHPRSVGPFTQKRMAEGCAEDLAACKLNAFIRVTGPHQHVVPEE